MGWQHLILFILGHLHLPAALAGVRTGVQVVGPTVEPGFVRKEGTRAESCPKPHLFPFNNHTACCASKTRPEDEASCPRDGGGDLLLASDGLGCCPSDQAVSCVVPPCKMHLDGFKRNGTQALLLARHGAYTWRFDPRDTPYPHTTSPWPAQLQHPQFMAPAGATEYPRGSGNVVVCGGALDTSPYTVLQDCYQYEYVEEKWTDFPPLLHDSAEGFLLTSDDGTLWHIAGYSRPPTASGGLPTDVTEYFDAASSSWLYGFPLPECFSAFGAAHLSGSSVALFGGYNYVWAPTERLYIFDLETGLYERKSNLPSAIGRSASGLISLPDGGGQALVSTARIDPTGWQEVLLYVVANDTWVTDAKWDLPGTARTVAMQRLANYDNQLYLFGGTSDFSVGRTYVRDVWRFDGPDADPAWTRVGFLPRDDEADVAVLVAVEEPY